MDKTKNREDEIDRKIAQLREKNKRIEQKFNMVQEEKRIAEAEAALVVSPKSPRNQKFKAFSNAHMDGRKVDRDNFKRDRGNDQDRYNTNRQIGRNSRQGNGSGDYAHSAHFQQSMHNHRTDQQMSDGTNFHILKQKNSQTYGRRRHSERDDDEMPIEVEEDFGWQNQRSFLYDPSRDRPGEPRRSVPPRNVQYQHRSGRGGRVRGGRGGSRGRGYSNNNAEVQMTGRERLEHERWLQQREEADRERMKRAQAGDGQWRRAWDVEKNHGKREERNDYEEVDDDSNYNHAVPHRSRRRGGRRSNDNRHDREAPNNRRTREETEVEELDSSIEPFQEAISSPSEEARKSKSRRGGRRGNRRTKNQAGGGDEGKLKGESSAVEEEADDDAKKSDEGRKKSEGGGEVAEDESSSCVDETSSLNASHTAYDLLSDDKSSADSSMVTADADKNDDERACDDEKDSSPVKKIDDGDGSCSENKPERNADVSIVESDLSNSTEFFDTVEEVADSSAKDDKLKSSHEIQKLESENEKYETQVEDCETEVKVSENKVEVSETQVKDSETKFEDSESQVEDSETKFEDSETQVEDSETQVEDSETKVEVSETKFEDSETKFEDSETKVEDSETKVE